VRRSRTVAMCQHRKSTCSEPWTRPEPEKDMPSEEMTCRQPGIVEIVGWIASHPEPLHYRPRALVRRRSEGYDFREGERPKPVSERQSGRLRRIALSPRFEGETPADLHTGGKMGAESCACKSGKTEKRGYSRISRRKH
jgi:hypothetical protein